jgi:hypothetical protein
MQLSTNDFRFSKERRVLSADLSDLRIGPRVGFPNTLDVRSEHTGKVVTFVKDHVAAERHEFWDGEMYEYTAHGTDVRLVLFND